MAVSLSGLKPARLWSTDFRTEKGSASTTRSAVTALVADPACNVSV
jgi:hypothetical protein